MHQAIRLSRAKSRLGLRLRALGDGRRWSRGSRRPAVASGRILASSLLDRVGLGGFSWIARAGTCIIGSPAAVSIGRQALGWASRGPPGPSLERRGVRCVQDGRSSAARGPAPSRRSRPWRRSRQACAAFAFEDGSKFELRLRSRVEADGQFRLVEKPDDLEPRRDGHHRLRHVGPAPLPERRPPGQGDGADDGPRPRGRPGQGSRHHPRP